MVSDACGILVAIALRFIYVQNQMKADIIIQDEVDRHNAAITVQEGNTKMGYTRGLLPVYPYTRRDR